ncbi:MAG TPA: PEP-CTERM sorting domain-containing protein [Caldimonas sp.]|nr:PEP-CTERM sorting domain-containing protein [Caldimonas sp.]
MKTFLLPATIFCVAIVAFAPAHAVNPGEIDTFSGGIEGWFAGGGPFGQVPPTPPAVIASGGPAGAGDSFLQIVANGSAGAGGRLVAMNGAQWAGNYLTAGISAIAMDLRNLGASDLTVRLYFEDPIPGPPVNEAVTTLGVLLPAGGGWTHALFPISPANLTVLQGNATTLLSNTTVLRIFSGAALDFPPDRVAGVLGVDNIQAIPEPETLALVAAGLALVAARTRRRATPV